MYTVYGQAISGNCYKLKLALSQLGHAFRWVEMDVTKGDTRTPEFLAKNANGKIPLLEIEPGVYLPESNAGLCYLAEGTALMPTDRLEKARVMQWLFWEQYSHEPYVAVARFIRLFLGNPPEQAARLADVEARSRVALKLMDDHLAKSPFMVGDRYTIADIALYAYTHVAEDGGIDLSPYAAIRAWFDRVRAVPGHVPMLETVQ